jgi:WD40 repeat protein
MDFASERLTLTGHSGMVYTICKFGQSILAGGTDGTIKMWDILK